MTKEELQMIIQGELVGKSKSTCMYLKGRLVKQFIECGCTYFLDIP